MKKLLLVCVFAVGSAAVSAGAQTRGEGDHHHGGGVTVRITQLPAAQTPTVLASHAFSGPGIFTTPASTSQNGYGYGQSAYVANGRDGRSRGGDGGYGYGAVGLPFPLLYAGAFADASASPSQTAADPAVSDSRYVQPIANYPAANYAAPPPGYVLVPQASLVPAPPSGYAYAPPNAAPAEAAPRERAPREPAAKAEALPEPDAVTLVFKDGRPREQIHNYALTRTMLYVTDKRHRDIPLDQLDLAATTKANEEAGVEFRLPTGR